MARWDPGAEDRLRRAALELYAEHGYDAVTIEQIAERAGLKRRSYFRYFADKREVLFAGSERLPAALAEAIAASDETSPVDALRSALGDVGTAVVHELGDRAGETRQRRVVIARTPELREREQSKTADVGRAVGDALVARGLPAPTAAVVGPLAAVVLGAALQRCLDQEEPVSFPVVLDELVQEIAGFARSPCE